MDKQMTVDPVIRIRDAAQILGISVGGLRNLVNRGDGPPALRIGHLIGFRKTDLEEWLRARAMTSASESAAA
jgi:excisionase family DNA binding protein